MLKKELFTSDMFWFATQIAFALIISISLIKLSLQAYNIFEP